MVSRKSFEDIKIFVDERVPYPHIDYIGRPVNRYLLHIPLPEKLVPLDLREDKLIMWRTFKACAAHEAGHAYLTDPLIYEQWKYKKDRKISSFVANLVEDFRVEHFLASKWPGLGADLALANALAYLRFHPLEDFDDKLKRIMVAVVSKVFAKRVKGDLTEHEERTLERIGEALRKVKWISKPNLIVSVADRIYKDISRYGSSDNIRTYPIAPPRDGRPSSEYLRSTVLGPNDDAQEVIKKAMREINEGGKLRKAFSKDAFSEVDYAFHRESIFRDKEKKILQLYQENKFNLVGVGFPKSDYAEFLKLRRKVIPIISRILGIISQVKSDYDEEPHQRSGLIDLNDAIQAVASESQRSDVFKQLQKTAESTAWAILVDESESLSTSADVLKQVSICLAEVANGLMSPNAWALYTFNDSLSIVKDFKEKYGKRVQYRLGGLTTGGPTYLPDALKVIGSRLSIVPQVYKVAVVVTDGQPHGYEGIK
ncbi:MAG: hypothetical protein ACE5NN_02910, partial [Candidatus Bathyarchaeia archaeon]